MSEIEDIKQRALNFLEKRRFERFKAGVQVRFRVVGMDERDELLKSGGFALPGAFMARASEILDLQHALTEDISLGGLRIPTSRPIVEGTDLWINLGLPQVPTEINALAVVKWSRPKGVDEGFLSGLQFEAINQRDLAQVEAFLLQQKKASQP